MKLKDLQDLDIDILLPLLRSYGVSHLTIDGMAISLGQLPATDAPIEADNGPTSDDKLLCGHSTWEANGEGLCLHGCINKLNEEEQ